MKIEEEINQNKYKDINNKISIPTSSDILNV